LTREKQSISDIVKSYTPDFEKQLETYQLATGATNEDIMRAYSESKDAYQENVFQEEEKATSAWEALQESIGGGIYGTQGEDILSGLLTGEGGYYERLEDQINTIDADHRYGWWGA